MTDHELQTEFAKLIPIPSRRYRAMRVMLARQAASAAAGPDHQEYFTQWQARLIEDAGEMINRSARWAKYRR